MSDNVRRLVQPAVPHPQEREPSTGHCEECRDEVPWTTLQHRSVGWICGRCEADFLYWQNRLGGNQA